MHKFPYCYLLLVTESVPVFPDVLIRRTDVNYCNSLHFAMSRLHIEKNWKNLNRGGHFCLFLPFCLLITSDLRCVHLPLNLSFHRCTLGGGVHASLSLDCQGIIPKNGQKCTPLFKNSREKNILNAEITKEG